jgi:hypothetical protein
MCRLVHLSRARDEGLLGKALAAAALPQLRSSDRLELDALNKYSPVSTSSRVTAIAKRNWHPEPLGL